MTFDAAGDAVFERYFAGGVTAALELTEGLRGPLPRGVRTDRVLARVPADDLAARAPELVAYVLSGR